MSFIFFIFLKIITFKIFFVFFPYFGIEPSTSIYFVYLSGMRCFSPSPKKTHLLLLFFIAFFTLRFLVFVVDRGLGVSSCAVVSRVILGCSIQYWMLLFFLRFQLMLETISPWVESEFSRLLMLSFSLLAYR